MKKILALFLTLLILLFLPTFGLANAQTAEQELFKQQLGSANETQLLIGQSEIAATELIRNFYQYNNYQLAWKQQSMIDLLLREIAKTDSLGLASHDYHLDEIKTRMAQGLNDKDVQRVQLDIILTDALVRLVYHLTYGKVVPGNLDPHWNFSRKFMSSDPVAKLHYSLRSEENLKKLLAQKNQFGPFYQGLVTALAQYRQIKQSGGWQPVPSGQVIKPAMKDPRIPLIKARLQASGDLIKTNNEAKDDVYNAELEAAVRQFQQRHQLEVDGVIGNGTLEQMNVPVEQRIEQIRVNLERIRWVQHNRGEEFVLVNIAGFKVYYVRDNQLIWESRVQVGKDYRQTPVFRDDIKYLVFNPTWTVPPTILNKDILPKLKKDPDYLQKKNMNVVDLKGNVINSAIDWSTITEKNFPYMIRQEPGPTNALGRVKIMFPNKHQIYLHDTPNKSNFKRAERAFSSGCIRVENPFELVELLLKDSKQWNQTRFSELLESGQLQNVNLPQTVPVLLLYFTARMDANGQVVFYKDIYNRDEKIILGLKQTFSWLTPERKKS